MTRLLIILALLLTAGCANIMTAATGKMADNLSTAILNQDDPETVRLGSPSYLILIDSLVIDNPEDVKMLLAGANMYSAYAGVFVDEPARMRRLSQKARLYAEQAACAARSVLCAGLAAPFPEFEAALATTNQRDVPVLHSLATAWAGWVQARSDDWTAIADLPKIDALFRQVVRLNESYDNGSAHMYLGVLNTQLPPSLGGKPELGRAHFERAIALSNGQNLMAKVLFAERYARLVFDQELHDRLLTEVLTTDPVAPDYTLINTLARERARVLLDESADYF